VDDFKDCQTLDTLPTRLPPEYIQSLTKHDFEQNLKELRAAYNQKYLLKKTRHPLAANLPRLFTDDQLIEFFATFPLKKEEIRRRLLRAFFYGLRAGEVDRAERVEGGFVKVDCLKKGRYFVYYLPFIEGTEKLFSPYTSTHKYDSIYLARCFSDRLKELGGMYCQKYEKSSDGRLLGRYSSHTLRRTAGNAVRRYTKEVYKAKIFLRHNPSSHFGCTAAYLDYDIEEMRKDLNETFKQYVEKLL